MSDGGLRSLLSSRARIDAGAFLPAFLVVIALAPALRLLSAALQPDLAHPLNVSAADLFRGSLAALGAGMATLALGALMAARLRDAGRAGWPAWAALSAAFLPATLNRLSDLGFAFGHAPPILAAVGPLLLLALGLAYARLESAG